MSIVPSAGAMNADPVALLADPPLQVVLILVGLVGSGKSTFAQALEDHLPQKFRRCNQDDLGDRWKVENLARQSLREGFSVCIDRTNFDATQRSHWVNIAREFPRTATWVIVFRTPYDVCATRLQNRTSHPTIKTPEQGLDVLARFSNMFREPSPNEGYQRLISLKPSDHPSPNYAYGDITSILQRLRDSAPVVSSPDSAFTNSPWPPGAVGGSAHHARGAYRGSRSNYYSSTRSRARKTTPAWSAQNQREISSFIVGNSSAVTPNLPPMAEVDSVTPRVASQNDSGSNSSA